MSQFNIAECWTVFWYLIHDKETLKSYNCLSSVLSECVAASWLHVSRSALLRNNSHNEHTTIFYNLPLEPRRSVAQIFLLYTCYIPFSVQFYIRMWAILSSIRWYDFFVCRVNRFRVMIDFLRNGSAYPVFCKTLPFGGLNGGHVWNVSHKLY